MTVQVGGRPTLLKGNESCGVCWGVEYGGG